MILALDSATETVSLALYDADGLLAEHSWHSRRRHTAELMPEVERVLARAALEAEALAGVAVTLGPGSFTGLRIALAAAKGLVAVLGIPLFGIPTLEAMAYPLRGLGRDLYPVIQAGRGRYCTARHAPPRAEELRDGARDAPRQAEELRDGARDAPRQAEELRVGSLDELAAAATDGLWFGELDQAARDELRRKLPPKAEVLGPTAGLRRAGTVAELGWARLQAGEADDAASLSPIYLRTAGLPGATQGASWRP